MSILRRLGVPVFGAGGVPTIDQEGYRLEVVGLIGTPRAFLLEEIKGRGMSEVDARLTSVSGWSVRAVWQGLLWRDFLKMVAPLPEADHAEFTSLGGGYQTTVSLADLDHPRVLLAWSVSGEPLEVDYGGPLRMVIPNLYGYKSAKWLSRIEFVDSMRGGYWEDRGYSRSGIIEPGLTYDCNTGERRPIKGGEVLEF